MRGFSFAGIVLLQLLVAGCSSDEPPAGGGVSGPAAASSGSLEMARPQASTAAVIAEALPYADVDEELVYGYFAIPVDMIEPLPAVIVVHDSWGLNDDVRDTAERLAGDGYIVLAVDLFLGQTAANPADARALEIGIVENPRLAAENLAQAFAFVRESAGAPSVAILGFGFGGNWAFNAALDSPDALGAAVSFYGQVRTRNEDLAELDVPYLGFFPQTDRAVPVKTARQLQEKAEALGLDVNVQIVDDGGRGFMEPSSEDYDEAVADDAWRYMLGFLHSRLNQPLTK